jgi:hypothetical protein
MFVKNLELCDKQSTCMFVHIHVNDINSDKNKLSQVKHNMAAKVNY